MIGSDLLKGDGTYSAYFLNFDSNGRYNVKVDVIGNDVVVDVDERGYDVFYSFQILKIFIVILFSPKHNNSELYLPTHGYEWASMYTIKADWNGTGY